MHIKACRRCGAEFLALTRGRLYCSDSCRRAYQNERRMDERALARELREQARATPMTDFWGRSDLDDWTAEAILANALIDPCPDMYDTAYDKVQRSYRVLQDKEMAKPAKMRQGWLM